MSAAPEAGPEAVPEARSARLELRRLHRGDAPFILRLLTDPQWLLHIGDRGVRDLHDAEQYIQVGPVAMYERHGFGLWLVELTATGEPMGMCGLLQRDYLPDIDLGFAFLPQYRGQGYALEAARAALDIARVRFRATRVAAITSQANEASLRLLEKLGFRFEGTLRVPPRDEELKLFIASF